MEMDRNDCSSLRYQLRSFYNFYFSDHILICQSWEIIFHYLKYSTLQNLHNGNLFSPNAWEFLRENEFQITSRELIEIKNAEECYQNDTNPCSSPLEALKWYCERDRQRNQFNKNYYRDILKQIENCCLKDKNINPEPLEIFRAFYKHLGIGFGVINIDSQTQIDFFENHEAISVFAINNSFAIYYLVPKSLITNEAIKNLFIEKLENESIKTSQILFHCGCRYDLFEIWSLKYICKCNERFYRYEVEMIAKIKKNYDLNKTIPKVKEQDVVDVGCICKLF